MMNPDFDFAMAMAAAHQYQAPPRPRISELPDEPATAPIPAPEALKQAIKDLLRLQLDRSNRNIKHKLIIKLRSIEKKLAENSPGLDKEADDLRTFLERAVLEKETAKTQFFCDQAFALHQLLTRYWPRNIKENALPVDPISLTPIPANIKSLPCSDGHLILKKNLMEFYSSDRSKMQDAVTGDTLLRHPILTQTPLSPRELAYFKAKGVFDEPCYEGLPPNDNPYINYIAQRYHPSRVGELAFFGSLFGLMFGLGGILGLIVSGSYLGLTLIQPFFPIFPLLGMGILAASLESNRAEPDNQSEEFLLTLLKFLCTGALVFCMSILLTQGLFMAFGAASLISESTFLTLGAAQGALQSFIQLGLGGFAIWQNEKQPGFLNTAMQNLFDLAVGLPCLLSGMLLGEPLKHLTHAWNYLCPPSPPQAASNTLSRNALTHQRLGTRPALDNESDDDYSSGLDTDSEDEEEKAATPALGILIPSEPIEIELRSLSPH